MKKMSSDKTFDASALSRITLPKGYFSETLSEYLGNSDVLRHFMPLVYQGEDLTDEIIRDVINSFPKNELSQDIIITGEISKNVSVPLRIKTSGRVKIDSTWIPEGSEIICKGELVLLNLEEIPNSGALVTENVLMFPKIDSIPVNSTMHLVSSRYILAKVGGKRESFLNSNVICPMIEFQKNFKYTIITPSYFGSSLVDYYFPIYVGNKVGFKYIIKYSQGGSYVDLLEIKDRLSFNKFKCSYLFRKGEIIVNI